MRIFINILTIVLLPFFLKEHHSSAVSAKAKYIYPNMNFDTPSSYLKEFLVNEKNYKEVLLTYPNDVNVRICGSNLPPDSNLYSE